MKNIIIGTVGVIVCLALSLTASAQANLHSLAVIEMGNQIDNPEELQLEVHLSGIENISAFSIEFLDEAQQLIQHYDLPVLYSNNEYYVTVDEFPSYVQESTLYISMPYQQDVHEKLSITKLEGFDKNGNSVGTLLFNSNK